MKILIIYLSHSAKSRLFTKDIQDFSAAMDFKPSYAIQTCELKLAGNFLVDGYNSFCGEYDISREPADVAYVRKAEIRGRANVTGEVLNVRTCKPPFDFDLLFERAKMEPLIINQYQHIF